MRSTERKFTINSRTILRHRQLMGKPVWFPPLLLQPQSPSLPLLPPLLPSSPLVWRTSPSKPWKYWVSLWRKSSKRGAITRGTRIHLEDLPIVPEKHTLKRTGLVHGYVQDAGGFYPSSIRSSSPRVELYMHYLK